jgi:hypothetical protein
MSTGIPPHTPTIVRVLGALALLVIGSVHFQQYDYGFYSSIPTIGSLVLANFVATSGLGLFLLSPVRLRGGAGATLDEGAAHARVGLAAGGFVALLVSEHTSLFGFTEHGYRFSIVLALTSEGLAVLLLTLVVVSGHTTVPSARSAASDAA